MNHLDAMPEAGDEVRQVLPERPLVNDGSRHALGDLHFGPGSEVPAVDVIRGRAQNGKERGNRYNSRSGRELLIARLGEMSINHE